MPVRAPDLWKAFNNPATITESMKWAYIAAYQNALLKQSDWTRLDDVEKSDTDKQASKAYRKTVRDLPNKADGVTNPDNIVFPDPPFLMGPP